ncbi:MAG: hypothetical protein IID54_04835 [Proteobacteria bacterium]|nr:hypothetical protein [Pseudomonadota bacterium]
MTSKAKPSNWQPGGLEKLEGFDDLYPEDVRLTIKEAIPNDLDAEKIDTLVGTAIWIALDLYVAEKNVGRATVPELKASISDIQDKARLLKKALASLDYDSRAQLHDAAEPDGSDGDIAVAETSRQIEKLQGWCQEALSKIGEATRGQQSNVAVKKAMVALAAALEKTSGKAPSGNSVINFAAAALSPVVGEIDFDWHWRKRSTV